MLTIWNRIVDYARGKFSARHKVLYSEELERVQAMRCYIILCDLAKDRNHEAFYEAIKSYRVWAHITESTWAIVTDKRAEVIRDSLMKHISSDDRLLVIRSGIESAWSNVLCTDEWLKKNL
jgi:hypothetical protein